MTAMLITNGDIVEAMHRLRPAEVIANTHDNRRPLLEVYRDLVAAQDAWTDGRAEAFGAAMTRLGFELCTDADGCLCVRQRA